MARSPHLHRLVVDIPLPWYERLQELATEGGNSVAAVVRIFLREALYDRLPGRRE